MALDLIDAVIVTLEGTEAVTSAFGDTWNPATQTGVPKFFGDFADQVPLPWCLLQEVGENYQYMTRGGPVGPINLIATGNMQFVIWASTREALRPLGLLIAKALNDAPLRWPNENSTMEFRMMNSSLSATGDVGPASPTEFSRVFSFEYVWSSTL